MNPLAIRPYLRLTPFNTNTSEGRAAERYRLAAWSVLANILSKSVALLLMVLSVKLTLPYLGAERFGIWMTIASFAGILTFLDLGVGNALTNHVAHAASHDDHSALQRSISGGLGFLLLLSIGVGGGLIILAKLLPWTSIIKVNNPVLHNEIQRACILFAGLFGLNLFTSGIQRVFAGLQQAFTAHLAVATSSLIALPLLWYAVSQQADIPTLLFITFGSQSFSGLLLLLLLTKRKLFTLSEICSAIHAEKNTLLHTGGLFFILQIGTMVNWGADNLIISSTLGATQVAIYSVTQRLFQFVSQPLAMINTPFWVAYADAHARGDKDFIRTNLINSLKLTTTLSAALGIIAIAIGPSAITIWTSHKINVSISLIIAFFFWTLCETTGNAFAMFLNGCNIAKPQVLTVITLISIAIPTKIIFIRSHGILGMLSSYTITYLVIVLGMYGLIFKKQLQSAWE